MFNRRIIDRILAQAGFPRVLPLTYALPSALPTVTWEARVEASTPNRQEFAVQIVFRHAEASPFAQACLALHGGERWAPLLEAYPQTLCGGLSPMWEFDKRFRPARSHASLGAEETAHFICEALQVSVVPHLTSISSERAFYLAISPGKGPLSWDYGQPLLRAAEVALLGLRLGISRDEMRKLLEEQAKRLAGQLHQVGVADYVEAVIQAASEQSPRIRS